MSIGKTARICGKMDLRQNRKGRTAHEEVRCGLLIKNNWQRAAGKAPMFCGKIEKATQRLCHIRSRSQQ